MYLRDGCGRCAFYRTPRCKVHRWEDELQILRNIILECGLKEELKWSQPCYTVDGKNVLLMSAFKEYAGLSFFKGALLSDPYGLLVAPGNHSRAVRQMRFTQVEEIIPQKAVIKKYILEAIRLEKEGRKIEAGKKSETIPHELEEYFKRNPASAEAFRALTPGRQRGWILYISQAKKPGTRLARIEKAMPEIKQGRGPHDGYRMKNKGKE